MSQQVLVLYNRHSKLFLLFCFIPVVIFSYVHYLQNRYILSAALFFTGIIIVLHYGLTLTCLWETISKWVIHVLRKTQFCWLPNIHNACMFCQITYSIYRLWILYLEFLYTCKTKKQVILKGIILINFSYCIICILHDYSCVTFV